MTNRTLAFIFFAWLAISLLIWMCDVLLGVLITALLLNLCLWILPFSLLADVVIRFEKPPRKLPFWFYFLVLTLTLVPLLASYLFDLFGGDLSLLKYFAD